MALKRGEKEKSSSPLINVLEREKKVKDH